jgi:hypothetical protein
MACTPCRILFGWSNQCGWDGRGMQHVWQHDWDKLRVLVKAVTIYTEGREFLGWAFVIYSKRTSLHGVSCWFRKTCWLYNAKVSDSRTRNIHEGLFHLRVSILICDRTKGRNFKGSKKFIQNLFSFETTTGWERRNWIQLAQHGIQWRTVVQPVTNLWVPQNCDFF